MKYILLFLTLIPLFASAQCESVAIGGTQYNIIMTLPLEGEAPSYWETSALDGTIIDQDSDGNSNHFAFNDNLYDNIVTCIHFGETVCCIEYFYDEVDGWVPAVSDIPQCDVDLIGYDPETHQVSVAIINGENCGCNEFTTTDGSTCGPDNSSSIVMNNETINHFVFGLHIYEDYTDGPCSQSNFHPGWTFAYPLNQSTLSAGEGLYTGDTLNVELNTFFDWECLLGTDLEDDQCWEMVVWQINLSQTADIIDFPTEYWTDTCGTCANQTQMYPDIDLSNNTLVWCPDELPPSPLYPGCTDEEADNFDINATFDDGSCEYTILGCQNPIACNYNSSATVDDGSCVVCGTPDGEELCNAYHNSDDYWDYYVDLFECEVDHQIDSTFFVEAGCDLLGPQFCQPQLRFHTDHTNVGDIPIYSYNFEFWSGDDWFIISGEYGINYNGGDNIYAVPLPAGQSGNTIQSFVFSGFEWEEGDTLWVESNVIGQLDVDTSNNLAYFILPEYPVCQWGCTDSLATNYNPDATCDSENCLYAIPGCTDELAINYNPFATDDDGSCIDPIVGCMIPTALNYNPEANTICTPIEECCIFPETELLYIDLECDLYCDETGAYYNAILYFDNIGNTTITNFCINYDILSGPDVIECFEGELPPGESITMEFGPITSDGGGGVIIRLETLEGEETDITWAQSIACYFDAVTICIFGCTDPEASNYNPNAEWDDGSCEYNIYGCTDATAINYNPDANVNDGSCIYDIPGCTDPTANNYNSLATINDGSCTYDVLGCTDPNALNYNPAANVNDGSCEYPIPGCTDTTALNYNEFATVEDGSCEYLEGCTDSEAINYNSLAILDDGSCVYPPEDCDGFYYAPNTFTPNNDGWGVVVEDENCWKEWNVQIYNRWGGLVWESSIVGEIWPASTGNGNYYVADGVYVYRVYGVGWDPSNTFTATGHITIFR